MFSNCADLIKDAWTVTMCSNEVSVLIIALHTWTQVFIDNKMTNVIAAKNAGFEAIHYFAMEQTEQDLEALLGAAGVCLDPIE